MTIRSTAARLLGASTLALAAFAAQPVLAQDAAATGAEEAADGQLNTIIVTANRREENLQDVAVSAATLDAGTVKTIFDAGAEVTALAARVPGLFVESSNGRAAPRFYIRGLGNTDFDLAASQPVSVVMDEIVLENVTLKSFPIFDVERIEVLRGPQGTLFGRNTPAGIVKIDTARPGDEFTAQFSASYGSFNSLSMDGGVTVPIAPGVASLRLSGLYQHRDNWIDNGFTGEDDFIGGFDELAGRAQLLITPDSRLSMLGTIAFRDLDATSTPFRANILGPRNNDLNANYDRDTVFYDAGGGNPADYDALIASFRLDYEADFATLTSITAYAESEGSSRGDIDGGFIRRDANGNIIETGPGLILFESDTQDSIDLDQLTHEVRLASNPGGTIDWQVGMFVFESDFDVTTAGFPFPPPVTVRHTNDAWAVFGQVSARASDVLKLTGGLRWTDDEKQFAVVSPSFASGPGAQFRSVEDDRLSWDLSAFLDVSDEASVYARLANGFRAPTIQGRDVAFGSPPSVATSEKIMSYEAGFKSEFAGRSIRLNGAVYYYTIEDPQFTAVGGAGNLVQLVNADKGRGLGFELDSAFQVTPDFLITAGVSWNDTKIQDDTLAVGICAQCTVTDPTVVLSGTTRALVDGNPFPNAPEWIADVTARYAFPVSDAGEVFVFTDWTYQGATNFLIYESLEFNANNQIEGGLRIGYARNDGLFEVAAFVRNITDADNVKGAIDFNNNTAFVNDPRVFGISARLNY
ncbi:TonB-dependent receptor [Erythrobacter sp. AP23]|uniref:TonB-dependent receptor n=1 Tax=Erythrobacter sp. AP23 TaxID=499656 RepID=UPI00076DB3CC|nr:TonB-dependent receptor [Erythrobacter sp. AP23]KWV94343.1 TonB-dependent receptor [Erythrobacter sp. AP23]